MSSKFAKLVKRYKRHHQQQQQQHNLKPASINNIKKYKKKIKQEMLKLSSILFCTLFFCVTHICQIFCANQSSSTAGAIVESIISEQIESENINNNNINNNNNNNWNETIVDEDVDLNSIVNHQKFGLFLFTQYCGPGDRVWRNGRQFNNDFIVPQSPYHRRRNSRTYRDIDACCKQHDGCPNYIENEEQHSKYPGLMVKPQMFARLQCTCDGRFYQCLSELNSRYANAVAVGYGLVQRYCFEFEHPIVQCTQHASVFGFRRCEKYIVDKSKSKQWQWFELPPAYRHIFNFPDIQ